MRRETRMHKEIGKNQSAIDNSSHKAAINQKRHDQKIRGFDGLKILLPFSLLQGWVRKDPHHLLTFLIEDVLQDQFPALKW